MALPKALVHYLLAVLFTVASAHVGSFDFRLLGQSYDHDADLLVLVGAGKSLRDSPLDKALQAIDQGQAGLTRTRGLQVTQCYKTGCTDFEKLMASYQLRPDDLPIVFLYPGKTENTKRGKFGVELRGEPKPLQAMKSFINSFDDDEDFGPWIRSLPAPKEDTQGSVRDVVGSTFEKEVVDEESHVVLLVYGDDAASKKLLPVFQQVSKSLDLKTTPATSDDSDDAVAGFRVTRFNNEANDFPPGLNLAHEITPEIYLFRGDDKGDPDRFPPNKERSKENIIDWVHKMLPQKYYGLDPFFAKLAKSSLVPFGQAINEHGSSHISEM